MNLFVADPEWGWWIVLYFFFGGIAAGAYFLATLIDLFGGPDDRGLARLGYRIAFPLILLCGLFLIVDLNRPERFWHMLFKSEVVKQALAEGWPSWETLGRAIMFKYWSPMSVGAWALMLFGLCASLSVLGSLWPDGRLAWLLRRSALGKLLQLVGSAVGFFVAAYTGALLTATNQPLWSDSAWIAPLFLTSAASTGIATMIVLAGGRTGVSAEALGRLERADLWALGLELVFFIAFLASLGALLPPILQTVHGLLLVGGTLLVGLLAPLAIHLRLGIAGRKSALAAAVLALAGGFLLRYAILGTPPELLARGPAVLNGFGPEAGRQPGGGPGADPGNYTGEVQPRSRVFDPEQP